MRVLTAAGRLFAQFGRYPVEALASLCHSVKGDERDGRCAAQRAPLRLHMHAAGLPAPVAGQRHPGNLGGA